MRVHETKPVFLLPGQFLSAEWFLGSLRQMQEKSQWEAFLCMIWKKILSLNHD